MYNVVVAYLIIQVLMALIFALKAHYLFGYHPNFGGGSLWTDYSP